MARYKVFELDEDNICAMDLSSLPLEPLPRLYASAGLKGWKDVKQYETDDLPENAKVARWDGKRIGWFYD
jgi:hypothetical protein